MGFLIAFLLLTVGLCANTSVSEFRRAYRCGEYHDHPEYANARILGWTFAVIAWLIMACTIMLVIHA